MLGHSAGGGVDAPDLTRVAVAALEADVSVALLEQPYRVAGRRGAAPAAQLDVAATAVIEEIGLGRPLVVGGRSSGARVACRTAAAVGARGVLALAFPLRPPWRPENTRLPELEQVRVPCLVIQGERDRFGSAADVAAIAPANVHVLAVAGADHSLARAFDVTRVRDWLTETMER